MLSQLTRCAKSHRRSPAHPDPEEIRGLLQSGVAASGDSATDTGAKVSSPGEAIAGRVMAFHVLNGLHYD